MNALKEEMAEITRPIIPANSILDLERPAERCREPVFWKIARGVVVLQDMPGAHEVT